MNKRGARFYRAHSLTQSDTLETCPHIFQKTANGPDTSPLSESFLIGRIDWLLRLHRLPVVFHFCNLDLL